jgi:cyclopropane-fatty-acyl-phospholipid synthase
MAMDVLTRLTIAEVFETVMPDGMPFRLEAYDGSSAGPPDAPVTVRLLSERGLAYVVTAPGDLGFARAYVSGDLELVGVHPANPYEAFAFLHEWLAFRMPPLTEVLPLLRSIGLSHLRRPAPPPEEYLPRWRRIVEGLSHSRVRDSEAIHHHYDVSNRFYEYVLGPSMTYSCAVFPRKDATLEEAQAEKIDLVARKLDLQPGQRLLDIGCGWGTMVRHAARHYSVQATGVTLSPSQAHWARAKVEEEGLAGRVDIVLADYRDLDDDGFDAICSIGMAEHVGLRNLPGYFRSLRARLRPGGRLLNHCIGRSDSLTSPHPGAFIDRYVFPDGELPSLGTVVTAAHDVGLEVRHVESLREHYALTLKEWGANLQEHWDEALQEVSLGTAKVWGLYMAGSRLSFEQNEIGVNQVLAVNVGPDGDAHMPLRPTWGV